MKTTTAFLLSTHLASAYFNVDFSAYPINSQPCLYTAASDSGCPASAFTLYDINTCLCSNDGNFVSNSASCIAQDDPADLQEVWYTMVSACDFSSTPLLYSETTFLAGGEASPGPSSQASQPTPTSSPPPIPASSKAPPTTSSKAPPTTFSRSTRSTTTTSQTTSTSPSPNPSQTGANKNDAGNNGNNVGRLSGGAIGLISAIAGVVAVILVLVGWCFFKKRGL